MKEEEIPDYNIFMMCEQLNENALKELNSDYYFRNCRPDELEIWKAFPFDSETVPDEYEDFMNQIIHDSYGSNMETPHRNRGKILAHAFGTCHSCTNPPDTKAMARAKPTL